MDAFCSPDIPLKGRMCLSGNSEVALIVLTGMQEHSLRYRPLGEYLLSEGADTYVLDLFGQGENISGGENAEAWPRHAFEKTAAAVHSLWLSVKERYRKVTIMGHSCGSFITQRYIELYPDTADGYILMGSNGPRKAMYALAHLLARMLIRESDMDKPGTFFENLALGPYAKPFEKENEKLAWLSVDKENIRSYREDPLCGIPCRNSFYLSFFEGLDSLYRRKALLSISKKERIDILSGGDDPVGEMGKGVKRLYAMYRKLGLADVDMKIYEGYRHEILNEDIGKDVYLRILRDVR